ncbi:hypothetical protein ACFL13_01230 [Patescibacteria group bacterium]
MKLLKELTQSITGILLALLIVGFLIIVAQVLKITGFLAFIDNLYPNNLVGFWALLAISRIGYSAFCGWALEYITSWLQDVGFFWFKPGKNRYYEEEYSKDKSGLIVGLVLLAALAFIIGEILIRICTWTRPLYMS